MALTLAGRSAQFGLAKQTTQGTAVMPSSTVGYWIKWRQGSMLSPKTEFAHEWEGDGNRGESLAYKKLQYSTAKHTFAPRPAELALFFAAFSGTGSDTITGAADPYTHTITPQNGNNDLYTLVQQYPQAFGSGAGKAYWLNAVDAICTSLTLTASASDPVLKIEADWMGLTSNQSGANNTGVTALTTNFQTEGPFYFYSTNGQWTLPAASAGAAIKDMNLKFSFDLQPADFQTENITPLPYIAGNIQVTGDLTLLWQDGGLAAYTYYGGSSGTTDSATTPTGAVSVQFTCASTTNHTFNLSLPNCAFESADFTPDLSGKPVEQKVALHALRYPSTGGAASPIYTATVANAIATAF